MGDMSEDFKFLKQLNKKRGVKIMAKFKKGDIVKHSTDGVYRILEVPKKIKLEYNSEPFYVYEFLPLFRYGFFVGGEKWARCKSEMEDGRFVKEELRL